MTFRTQADIGWRGPYACCCQDPCSLIVAAQKQQAAASLPTACREGAPLWLACVHRCVDLCLRLEAAAVQCQQGLAVASLHGLIVVLNCAGVAKISCLVTTWHWGGRGTSQAATCEFSQDSIGVDALPCWHTGIRPAFGIAWVFLDVPGCQFGFCSVDQRSAQTVQHLDDKMGVC